MSLNITKDDVGSFELSIKGDSEGNNVSITVQGTGVAILGGMNALVDRVGKILLDSSPMTYNVFRLSILERLADAHLDIDPDEDEAKTAHWADIKPSASPNQEQVDKMLDKLFGRTS